MIRAALLIYAASMRAAFACEAEAGALLIGQTVETPKAVVFLDDIPLAQPFGLKIDVCNLDAALTLNVDAIMPAHQHGMNYTPTITALGQGAFEARGMVFHMPGIWEIQVTVAQGDHLHRYTHRVSVR